MQCKNWKTACTTLGLLAAAGSALAHPGHGAELWHSHGEMTLGVGALALAVLGAGLMLAGAGDQARLQPLRRWGVRLGSAGLAAAVLLVLLHG